MGLFGDIDIASASTILGPPAGVYLCTVTSFEVKDTAKGDKRGLNITYTILHGVWMGRDFYEWIRVPDPLPVDADDEAKAYFNKKTGQIKRRLEAFGVPESRMNDMDPADVIGVEVAITTAVKKQPDEQNPTYISAVSLPTQRQREAVSSSNGSGGGVNPFADVN